MLIGHGRPIRLGWPLVYCRRTVQYNCTVVLLCTSIGVETQHALHANVDGEPTIQWTHRWTNQFHIRINVNNNNNSNKVNKKKKNLIRLLISTDCLPYKGGLELIGILGDRPIAHLLMVAWI